MLISFNSDYCQVYFDLIPLGHSRNVIYPDSKNKIVSYGPPTITSSTFVVATGSSTGMERIGDEDNVSKFTGFRQLWIL